MGWRNGALMECEATRRSALECYSELCSPELRQEPPDGEAVAQLFARMSLTSLGGFIEAADAHDHVIELPADIRKRVELAIAWFEGFVDPKWRECCYDNLNCG